MNHGQPLIRPDLRSAGRLALHCLTPHGESLLAYYDSPASVFAAMLAHRTAGGCASLSEYTAEFNRLSAIFSQEWQHVTGYQP
ncbi:hypothetical protein QU870_36170 [Escherichia coli]|nr:hypothetical protein [Escherichia coli]